MIDLTTRQTVLDMKRLPDDEYQEARRGMAKALRGVQKGMRPEDIKCVEVDGRLRLHLRIGAWWYWPHATDGWRFADK